MEGTKEIAAARPPERFETARLRLRAPLLTDAPDVFTYASDPEVTRYLLFPTHRGIETVEDFLRTVAPAAERGESYNWAITMPDADRVIGMHGVRCRGTAAELGYVLAKSHWGRGYMAEALRPIVDWAMSRESIHRVWAVCDLENHGSVRVLEKLGMQREGILRKWAVLPNRSPVPRDCYCYSIVRG